MPNVVVTGASRGLGLGVAHKLTTVGYNVIGIARRDSERLSSVMRQVERSGQGSLHFRPCDLANISDIPDLAKDYGGSSARYMRWSITRDSVCPAFSKRIRAKRFGNSLR